MHCTSVGSPRAAASRRAAATKAPRKRIFVWALSLFSANENASCEETPEAPTRSEVQESVISGHWFHQRNNQA